MYGKENPGGKFIDKSKNPEPEELFIIHQKNSEPNFSSVDICLIFCLLEIFRINIEKKNLEINLEILKKFQNLKNFPQKKFPHLLTQLLKKVLLLFGANF